MTTMFAVVARKTTKILNQRILKALSASGSHVMIDGDELTFQSDTRSQVDAAERALTEDNWKIVEK